MYVEKPPMMSRGDSADVLALRDYLFRLARTLEPISEGGAAVATVTQGGVTRSSGQDSAVMSEIDKMRKNAKELQALIIKSADQVLQESEQYTDGQKDYYDSLYVAQSEYGQFTENINTTIENTARGVVESYNYGAQIESMQDGIDLIQNYFTNFAGEIRRGIVLDPSTNEYVTGIAISQNLRFAGECGPNDSNNPGDGYTYYYLTSGQTFGLYTSTGWQFWIDGAKKGWFSSVDGMLHVTEVYVENKLNLNGYIELVAENVSVSSSSRVNVLHIRPIGG